jgi:NitT/TauT family transport system substrate-binding protein
MMRHRAWLAAAAFCVVSSAQAADRIDVGMVASMGRAPEFIAFEKGYFKELDLDVRLTPIDSTSDAAALNAQGTLPILAGGISVGYFNSIAKGFPIKLMLEASSTPIFMNIMVRPDLRPEMRTLADLKGRSLDVIAPGSINVYVAAKLLASVGLTLKDVDLKYIPYGQVAPAFANKAIDAGVIIQPTTATLEGNKLALPWIDPDDVIRPTPMLISGSLVNTEWLSKNRDAARRFFIAMVRGIREYCTAYHDGDNRREVVAILAKWIGIKDPAYIDKMIWQSRTPTGEVPTESLLDIQKTFFDLKLTTEQFPLDRLIDMSLVKEANAQFPAFVPPAGSTKKGCR